MPLRKASLVVKAMVLGKELHSETTTPKKEANARDELDDGDSTA